MKLTLKEISGITGGTVDGDTGTVITGVAAIEDAADGDISVFYDRRFSAMLSSTGASALIVPEKLPVEDIRNDYSRALLRAADPRMALMKLLERVQDEFIPAPDAGVHGTAVVSGGAKLGKDTSVGAGSVVENGAVLGSGCRIYAQCYVGNGVKIGDSCTLFPGVIIRERCIVGNNVTIHPGTVIGSDGYGYISSKQGHRKIPQIGIVEIQDNVEIGANVAIDRATVGRTVVGAGTKIDNLVHIAHNINIGNNCLIMGQVGMAGSARLGNNVMIAGQSGITDHAVIGDGVRIAGHSGVIGNIEAGQTVSGFPARSHREYMKIQACMGKLPGILRDLRELKGRKKK